MSKKKSQSKRKKKDKYIGVRVDPELHERAMRRAQKDKRSLSEVIRAWLRLYADEEIGAPSDDLLDEERQRPPRKKKEDG